MNKFIVALVFISAVSSFDLVAEEDLHQIGEGQQCANAINSYVVSSFDITPFPPKKGVTVTSTSVGKFTQAETITGIKVDVLLDGKNFYQEIIPQSGTYAVGQTGTFTYGQSIPGLAPKGSYTINGGLVNANKQQINCWQVAFQLT